MNDRKKLLMPVVFAVLIITGMFIGAKLAPVNRMFGGSMSASIYNYNKIQDILYLLERDYVDKVDQKQLVDLAIQGLLQQLDPHSVYITAEQLAAVNEEIKGNFEGVGVQFSIRYDTIRVISVIRGSPAEKAGVLAGDRIVTVDGKNVAGTGVTNEQVMKLLKGPKGTTVVVGINRPGRKGLLSFDLVRDVIRTNSIGAAYMLTNRTGYIKLNTFAENTYTEFMEEMDKLQEAGMNNLVLDLRGNGGGLLEQSIRIANEFLGNKELIVYTMGKSGKKKISRADGKGSFQEGGLAVLIDDLTASASEIIAGAIQDNDRGFIIGRRSFGKGLVQQQITLADGSALRITTERYYTPAGRSIQKPYSHDQEEYYAELLTRYNNGGMDVPDTTPVADSLQFQTLKKKRTVYGGGGITPDYFIPLHQKHETELFKKLSNTGIIFEYAIDFADKNRYKILEKYDADTFIKAFMPDAGDMKSFYLFSSSKGVPVTVTELAPVESRILFLIKAFVARDLFGEEPYFIIMNQQDKAVQKAVNTKQWKVN